MKTALLTLNVNNVLRSNSRASFHAAAQRWGCDYVEITETDTIPIHATKLKCFDLCDADRIFYIDADTVISAGCPSPFDTFPEDAFVAVVNNQQHMSESCLNACADNIARDMLTINKIFGYVGPTYPKRFVNSGMFVASRQYHADVLHKSFDVSVACSHATEWRDQSALNHTLIVSQTPVLAAPDTWNYQFPPDTGAGPMLQFIYHWAGGENKDQIDKVNWRSFHVQAKKKRPKLLVIADHEVHTGFARVAENVCMRLLEDWDVEVIGINYNGMPHDRPYKIYPAGLYGDLWGVNAFRQLLPQIKPDVIFTIQDPWIVVRYATEIDRHGIPLIAYMPVDARNQNSGVCNALSKGLDLAIFYTKFGERECRLASYTGQAIVIPHGVDTKLYHPMNQWDCRRAMITSGDTNSRIGKDSFIVGNVNRNQPRKRLDLTVQYFAEWLRRVQGDATQRIKDAFLYIHCSQRDSAGWDLAQLAHYYGIADRILLPDENVVTPAQGLDEAEMPYVYNCFSVQVTTCTGEGWGLSQMEGSACGIPQIVPQYAALGEWMSGAACMIPVADEYVTHSIITTIGAVPQKDAFINALDAMYKNKELREKYATRALSRATEEQYSWDAVAKKFNQAFAMTLARKEDNAKKDK